MRKHVQRRDIQPSDDQMAQSFLLYGSLMTPKGLTYTDPEWSAIIEAGSEFGEEYEQLVRDAVALYGVDPGPIEADYVIRPPMAGSLIPEFFVNLDPVSQGLLASATWDGFKLGIRFIHDGIRRLLRDKGLPENAYTIVYSPHELASICLQHIRESFHPRAHLTVETATYNTYFDGHYALKLDKDKPIGWEITVRSDRVEYVFIVDSKARVSSFERREGARCEVIEIPQLLEDHVQDY